VTKIVEKAKIPKNTLRSWMRDGDWIHRARVQVIFSGFFDFLPIPIIHLARLIPAFAVLPYRDRVR